MRSLRSILLIALGVVIYATSAYAYYDPKKKPANPTQEQVNYREACTTAGAQIDQDVNNVRARLTTGGDVWWDRSDGKYVVPKVEPGQQEISSIFAGAVWLGGFDDGGNLKVACQTYGNGSNQSDFWPGPLRSDEEAQELNDGIGSGATDKEICDNWDRFWEVEGAVIDEHIATYQRVLDGELSEEDFEELIDPSIKGWPADNNPFFFDVNGFDLPNPTFGYKNFFDFDDDGDYNPARGDYPAIFISKCEEFPPQYPDEMIYWIYNDEGGGAIHGETEGTAIRMEVQVQAFAYATNDQINDMTFQRYRLNNRALESLDSTYFAMWVDADLGCYLDDYIGCDTSRSLAYTYNEDALDEDPGCTGIGVYGESVPIIGIDYFRGPKDEFGNLIGMSSFTYFNNPSFGSPAPDINTTDPSVDTEFYHYLSGRWKFGERFSFGGDGFDPNNTQYIDFAFVDDPDATAPAWSMCTAGLPAYDRRTVQASGPFRLDPGAVNELIIGAVWVPNLTYPCPDISRLKVADDLAQDLFDNCFDLVDGPDAPDVDWVELDRELVAVFSNAPSSNNYLERYEEPGIGFDPQAQDTTYKFEGYLLYQLANPNVGTSDFDNPELAKLIYQVDLKNDLAFLYNWESVPNPNYVPNVSAPSEELIWFPEVKVEGANEGIRRTFQITEDQFATGDRRLLNHRKYYFSAIAYAHNEWAPFDQNPVIFGQPITYIEGRRNIKTYAPIPRPITDVKLNSTYGDGPVVTRLDGIGVGGNFLDISDETKAAILDGSFDGTIVYKEGRGPIDVSIYNPLEVVDGDYEITFIDEDMDNDELDDAVFWKLTSADGFEIFSDTSIDIVNEQIIGEYGFSINIGQSADVGTWDDPSDGGIGAEIVYESTDKPFWFSGIQDGFEISEIEFAGNIFDFVRYNEEAWEERDHTVLGNLGTGFFVPYQICDVEDRSVGGTGYYLTPAWRGYQGGSGDLVLDEELLTELNNVDIVFTSDKSLWSRCVIVETIPPEFPLFEINENEEPWGPRNDYDGPGEFLEGEDPVAQFDLRAQASVGKEADSNGMPIPDGELDEDGDPQIGMGWFPGYAIDVESGKRVNVFFGENSAYSEANGNLSTYNSTPNGDDMMFNPTSQITLSGLPNGEFRPANYFAGGHHYVYVTSEEYDECAYHRERLNPKENALKKINALKRVTWAGLPVLQDGQRMLSYAEGLIPNEMTYKLRVDNPYQVEVGTDVAKGYPTYQFSIEGKAAEELDAAGVEDALDMINVVPNPYYAYSEYEGSRLSTIVKITNLPAKCVVTIYSLDGKFIRQYNRDEQPGAPAGNAIPSAQVVPDLEWDLKNNKGIPISAGIYLIHVDAPGFGERTLKWFGVSRKFDPSGL